MVTALFLVVFTLVGLVSANKSSVPSNNTGVPPTDPYNTNVTIPFHGGNNGTSEKDPTNATAIRSVDNTLSQAANDSTTEAEMPSSLFTTTAAAISTTTAPHAPPMPLWPHNNLEHPQPFVLSPIGGSYAANECNFIGPVILEVFGLFPNASASIVFTRGTVSRDASPQVGMPHWAGIRANFPTDPYASGPISLTVRDMLFGADAILHFVGAFPPRSSLVVENNTFSLLDEVVAITIFSLDGADLQLVQSRIAISDNYAFVKSNRWPNSLLGVHVGRLVLSESSAFIASRNTLEGTTTRVSGVVFLTSGDVLVSNFSSIDISRNRLSNVVSLTGISSVVRWDFCRNPMTVFNVSDHSTFTSSGNKLEKARVPAANVVFWHSFVSMHVTLSGASELDMSENAFRDGTVSSPWGRSEVIVVLWLNEAFVWGVTLLEQSTLKMNRNVATNFTSGMASVVSWQWFKGSSIALSTKSIIDISDNLISSAQVSSSYEAKVVKHFTWAGKSTVTLSDASQIALDGNAIRNSEVYFAYVVYWEINHYLTEPSTISVLNGSVISMDRNSASDVYATFSDVNVVFWTWRNPLTFLVRASTIRMNKNSVERVTAFSYSAVQWYWELGTSSSVAETFFEDRSDLQVNHNSISGMRSAAYVGTDSAVILFVCLGDGQFSWSLLSKSMMQVYNNTAAVGNVDLLILNLPAQSLTLADKSRINVVSNDVSSAISILFRSNVNLKISRSSSLSVCNNHMMADYWSQPMVVLDGELHVNIGEIIIEDNTVETVVGAYYYTYLICSPVTMVGATAKACRNNLTWSPYLTVAYLSPRWLVPSGCSGPIPALVPTTTSTAPSGTVTDNRYHSATRNRETLPPAPTTMVTRGRSSLPPTSTVGTNPTILPTSSLITTSAPSATVLAAVTSTVGTAEAEVRFWCSRWEGTFLISYVSNEGQLRVFVSFKTQAARASFVAAANQGQIPSIATASGPTWVGTPLSIKGARHASLIDVAHAITSIGGTITSTVSSSIDESITAIATFMGVDGGTLADFIAHVNAGQVPSLASIAFATASQPPTSNNRIGDVDTKPSTGTIAWIAAAALGGVALLVVVIGGVVLYLYKKRKSLKQERNAVRNDDIVSTVPVEFSLMKV